MKAASPGSVEFNFKSWPTCLVVAFFLAALMTSLQAATYHFDSQNGSDAANGRTPQTAWKTLAKMSGLSLVAGDIVLLKRGSTFTGALVLDHVFGTKEAPFTVDAYDEGPLPKIRAGTSSGITYNSYIYNNTIFVKQEQFSWFQFRYTIDGVLIANNIFHILGPTGNNLGNRRGSEPGNAFPQRAVFNNNLYLRSDVLPAGTLIKDSGPLVGDAGFVNPGGLNAEDYLPTNSALVKDAGMVIANLPGDPTGLSIGLSVLTDILGHPIQGLPDLGAIESTDEPPWEVGLLRLKDAMQTVTLGKTYRNPVIIVGPPSYEDAAPTTVRVTNVGPGGFDVGLEEWEYQDGLHAPETSGYLVMEAGQHRIGGLLWEAGIAPAVNQQTSTITLQSSGFDGTQTILAQVVTRNGSANVPRVSHISAHNFQLFLQGEEAQEGLHNHESVHYLAVQRGHGVYGDQSFLSGHTSLSSAWQSIPFTPPIARPIFLGNSNSLADLDPVSPRLRNLSPEGVEALAQEEESADSESNHGVEDFGFLVLPYHGALPPPWQMGIIGTNRNSSAHGYNETFEISGAGVDFWDIEDAGTLNYQTMRGDTVISLRVDALDATHPWAQAGVMIRESLAAGSKHAAVVLTPANGIHMNYRGETNDRSSVAGNATPVGPTWLRLTRHGDRLTGQVSSDGDTWFTVGSLVFPMAETILVGMFHCSHDAARAGTATFSEVRALDLDGGYEDWLRLFFGESRLNSPETGLRGNPDGDPFDNQWEFIMGLHPGVADPASTSLVMEGVASNTHVSWTFRENKTLAGFTRRLVSSTHLSPWAEASGVTLNPVEDLGEAILWRAVATIDGESRFYRVLYLPVR